MRTKVNNYEMTYEDEGSGLPVLFIHGYPLNRSLWQPQVEGLSDWGGSWHRIYVGMAIRNLAKGLIPWIS